MNRLWWLLSACTLMLCALVMRIMNIGPLYAMPVLGAGIVAAFVWAWQYDRRDYSRFMD